MADPILVMHRIPISFGTGGATIQAHFLASPKTYGGIENDTGVSRPSATNLQEYAGARRYDVAELLKFNDVQSVVIYYVKNGKKNRALVLCTKAKAETFLTKDGTLNYQGDTKAKVRQPRRATFT